MCINKRIREIRRRFCEDKNNVFAAKLEKSPNTTCNYVRNGYSVGKGVAREICDAFNVNPEWLLTGEGEMLKSDAAAVKDTAAGSGVPFYDIDVTCGIAESFSDVPEVPQYRIDLPPLNDCDAAFPVYGDSMEPDFYAGDIVLVRQIRNVDSMLWGEPYLVITNAECDNLRTIKNVYISPDRTKFILRASNPRYEGDTIVPIDNVLKIYLVKGKICRRQL